MANPWNAGEFFAGLRCHLGAFTLVDVEQDEGDKDHFTCIFEPMQIEGMMDDPKEFRQEVYAQWDSERSMLSFWMMVETGIPLDQYEWAIHALNSVVNVAASSFISKGAIIPPGIRESDCLILTCSWVLGFFEESMLTDVDTKTLQTIVRTMMLRLLVESSNTSVNLTQAYAAGEAKM